MAITPSSDNTVLALDRPKMPGATAPVVGAHCGVPKRIYDLEPMGARVDVDAYPGQEPGDTVLLNLNDQPGIASKQTQSDADNVTLYIPKKLLLPDIVNRLTYTIMRGSQNQGTSQTLELLYNLFRPGNQDRDPGVDGHSELELLLPDEIKNGVGPDFPVAGVQVCVSYPYCRAYDVIRLNLNGHDVYHTVTELQAPLPGSATPVQVCFTVTRADLAGGGDHPQYAIAYTVTDQLGNGPDTDSPWSASQVVDVDLAGRQLVAPDLAEDPDDPSDDPSTIDLSKLGKKDLTVLVHVFTPQWQTDDVIRVTYSATPPTGPVTDQLVTANVIRIPFTYKLMVPNAKVLPDSVVRARYEQVRNNVVMATSRTTTARVIGEGAVELRPPFLVAPATNPIDVLAYATGVTVRVEHLSAVTGDSAQLIEVNPLPGTPAFPVHELNANHRANFTLSPAFLAARQGKDVALKWVLIRNGVQVGESLPLQLKVNRIADGDTRLPVPVIPQANGTLVLDMNMFSSNPSVTIKPWPSIGEGQKIWLFAKGTHINDEPYSIPIIVQESVTQEEVANGLSRTLLRSEVEQLKNNTALQLEMNVSFNGASNEQEATRFPRQIYLLIADSWQDSITDFTDGTSGGWKKGPAGFQGYVTNGVFYNTTTAYSGHAGILFSQAFFFTEGRTYSFSYKVNNFSPLVNNRPPIFSVSTASGQQILPSYTVPRSSTWNTQSATFSVTQTGEQVINLISHEDRGGGAGSDGGNDYQIDDIVVRRLD